MTREEKINKLREKVEQLPPMISGLGLSELEDVYDVFLDTIKETLESSVSVVDDLLDEFKKGSTNV